MLVNDTDNCVCVCVCVCPRPFASPLSVQMYGCISVILSLCVCIYKWTYILYTCACCTLSKLTHVLMFPFYTSPSHTQTNQQILNQKILIW